MICWNVKIHTEKKPTFADLQEDLDQSIDGDINLPMRHLNFFIVLFCKYAIKTNLYFTNVKCKEAEVFQIEASSINSWNGEELNFWMLMFIFEIIWIKKEVLTFLVLCLNIVHENCIYHKQVFRQKQMQAFTMGIIQFKDWFISFCHTSGQWELLKK